MCLSFRHPMGQLCVAILLVVSLSFNFLKANEAPGVGSLSQPKITSIKSRNLVPLESTKEVVKPSLQTISATYGSNTEAVKLGVGAEISQEATLSTPKDTLTQVVLPDGATVVLDENTRVQLYRKSATKQWALKLTEGTLRYFTPLRSKLAFIPVETTAANVSLTLPSDFMIRHRKSEGTLGSTLVMLLRGQLDVRDTAGKETATLSISGEQIHYSDDPKENERLPHTRNALGLKIVQIQRNGADPKLNARIFREEKSVPAQNGDVLLAGESLVASENVFVTLMMYDGTLVVVSQNSRLTAGLREFRRDDLYSQMNFNYGAMRVMPAAGAVPLSRLSISSPLLTAASTDAANYFFFNAEARDLGKPGHSDLVLLNGNVKVSAETGTVQNFKGSDYQVFSNGDPDPKHPSSSLTPAGIVEEYPYLAPQNANSLVKADPDVPWIPLLDSDGDVPPGVDTPPGVETLEQTAQSAPRNFPNLLPSVQQLSP